MDDFNLIESLGQVSSSEAGGIFRNFLRGGVRQRLLGVRFVSTIEFNGRDVVVNLAHFEIKLVDR